MGTHAALLSFLCSAWRLYSLAPAGNGLFPQGAVRRDAHSCCAALCWFVDLNPLNAPDHAVTLLPAHGVNNTPENALPLTTISYLRPFSVELQGLVFYMLSQKFSPIFSWVYHYFSLLEWGCFCTVVFWKY